MTQWATAHEQWLAWTIEPLGAVPPCRVVDAFDDELLGLLTALPFGQRNEQTQVARLGEAMPFDSMSTVIRPAPGELGLVDEDDDPDAASTLVHGARVFVDGSTQLEVALQTPGGALQIELEPKGEAPADFYIPALTDSARAAAVDATTGVPSPLDAGTMLTPAPVSVPPDPSTTAGARAPMAFATSPVAAEPMPVVAEPLPVRSGTTLIPIDPDAASSQTAGVINVQTYDEPSYPPPRRASKIVISGVPQEVSPSAAAYDDSGELQRVDAGAAEPIEAEVDPELIESADLLEPEMTESKTVIARAPEAPPPPPRAEAPRSDMPPPPPRGDAPPPPPRHESGRIEAARGDAPPPPPPRGEPARADGPPPPPRDAPPPPRSDASALRSDAPSRNDAPPPPPRNDAAHAPPPPPRSDAAPPPPPPPRSEVAPPPPPRSEGGPPPTPPPRAELRSMTDAPADVPMHIAGLVTGQTLPPVDEPHWSLSVFGDHYAALARPGAERLAAAEADFALAISGVGAGAMAIDVGCGDGTHAATLADRGLRVLGLDTAPSQLRRAAELHGAGLPNLRWLLGDVRQRPIAETFDLVTCVGTGFGQYDDGNNRVVLEALRDLCRPSGGRLVLHVLNRDYAVSRLPARSWWQGQGCLVLDEVEMQDWSSRLAVRRTIVFEDGRQFEHSYSLRAYALHELVALCDVLGLRVLEASGSRHTRGRFFGATSPDIWLSLERR